MIILIAGLIAQTLDAITLALTYSLYGIDAEANPFVPYLGIWQAFVAKACMMALVTCLYLFFMWRKKYRFVGFGLVILLDIVGTIGWVSNVGVLL